MADDGAACLLCHVDTRASEIRPPRQTGEIPSSCDRVSDPFCRSAGAFKGNTAIARENRAFASESLCSVRCAAAGALASSQPSKMFFSYQRSVYFDRFCHHVRGLLTAQGTQDEPREGAIGSCLFPAAAPPPVGGTTHPAREREPAQHRSRLSGCCPPRRHIRHTAMPHSPLLRMVMMPRRPAAGTGEAERHHHRHGPHVSMVVESSQHPGGVVGRRL